MRIPIAGCLFFIESRDITRVVNRAAQSIGQDNHVQHDSEVVLMELLDHFPWVRKNTIIPSERAIFGIPPRGTKSGAQIDHRVTGKPLLAERFRFTQNLLTTGERPMRLLISKTPQRRHFRVAGQTGVFGHKRCGIPRTYEEKVERKREFGLRWHELALRAGEVKGAKWVVNEHRPTGRADQPRNGDAATV